MPGITNPAEEYFKDGLWGWVSTAWEKLVSSGGRLFTALHGWDGSAWRKLPLIWGYSDRWSERVTWTADTTNDHAMQTTAVGAGYVYVLQGMSVYNAARALTNAIFFAVDGAVKLCLVDTSTTAAYRSACWQGEITLKQDDFAEIMVGGHQVNDTIYATFWGYKMKIAE